MKCGAISAALLNLPELGQITFRLLLCTSLMAGCSVRVIKEEEPKPFGPSSITLGSRPVRLIPNPAEAGTAYPANVEPETASEISIALSQPQIAEEIRKNGLPDAAETHPSGTVQYTTLYYRSPPRTLVYRVGAVLLVNSFEQVADIPAVPRTARRLGFLEGPMPPPWPVTVPRDKCGYFDTLESPSLPPSIDPAEFAASYVPISSQIRAGIIEIHQGIAFERASRQLARLNAVAKAPAFNWTLVIFRSQANFAFTVPDGSLFVSDGLVERLSDDELVAILAHVVAHQIYGHDRSFWTEVHGAKKAAAIAGLAVLVLALETGAAAVNAPSPIVTSMLEKPPPPPRHFAVYVRGEEAQANYAAVAYLASAGIPPDTLFDAMVKLSSGPVSETGLTHFRSAEQSAEFQNVHEADRSAADLGKMLDAGIIPNGTSKDSERKPDPLRESVVNLEVEGIAMNGTPRTPAPAVHLRAEPFHEYLPYVSFAELKRQSSYPACLVLVADASSRQNHVTIAE